MKKNARRKEKRRWKRNKRSKPHLMARLRMKKALRKIRVISRSSLIGKR